MMSQELIAIMLGCIEPVPDLPMQFVTAQGYTALLDKRPAPLIKLPLSRTDVLRSAAERQAWLECCMPYGTILPVCPNSFLTQADVPLMIAANRPLLDQLTLRLTGKEQFQITVSWDAPQVLDRFRDAPELAPLFAAGKTSADALQRGVTALSTRLRDDILDTLGNCAAEMLTLPPGQDMLANVVVLQQADKLPALDHALAQIDAIWTEGFRIKQIGPAPAASFASIALQRVSQKDLTDAARLLGCNLDDTADKIAQARQQALKDTPARAADIKESADVLDAMARHGKGPQPLYLCSVRSDDQAATLPHRKVA